MDELHGETFERRSVGPSGSILLRRNAAHEKRSILAIRFRDTPRWSADVDTYRVTEKAA